MTNEIKKDLKVLIAVIVVMVITAFALNKAYGEEYDYSNMYETEFGIMNAINNLNSFLDKANETNSNEDWLNYRRESLRYNQASLKYYQTHLSECKTEVRKQEYKDRINFLTKKVKNEEAWIKYYEDRAEYDKQWKLIEEVKEYNSKEFMEAYRKSKKAGKLVKPNYKEEPAAPKYVEMPKDWDVY